MGLVDRTFERKLDLHPGEEVRWRVPANHTVGGTWIAGYIYVTDRRFFFCPGLMSRRRSGILAVPLSAIRTIDVIDRAGRRYDARVRRRLRVGLAEGSEHLFITAHVSNRTAQLQSLIAI